MKSIITGIIASLFIYMVISMHNKTWDIMNYSQDSVYWFGSLIGLAWFAVWMWGALESNKDNNNHGF